MRKEENDDVWRMKGKKEKSIVKYGEIEENNTNKTTTAEKNSLSLISGG